MKIRSLALVMVLGCSSWLVGQSTTPQTPPAGAQGQSSAGTEQSTAPAGHAGMHHNMSQGDMMGPQHMQAMKQQVAKMQTLLDQMKSNVAGMSGANKTAMETNVQLWQMMIDHMNQMVQHMSSMGGMMQHRGMGAGHHAMPAQPAAPATGEKPPQSDQTKNPPPPQS